MPNELDKYAHEYANPNRKIQPSEGEDKVDKIPQDEKLPLKAMPMTTREKPFKVTGGGDGGQK